LRADRELGSIPVLAVALSDWSEALTAAGCSAVLPRPLADGALVEAAAAALGGTSAKRGSRGR
jgi:hypothetical protein